MHYASAFLGLGVVPSRVLCQVGMEDELVEGYRIIVFIVSPLAGDVVESDEGARGTLGKAGLGVVDKEVVYAGDLVGGDGADEGDVGFAVTVEVVEGVHGGYVEAGVGSGQQSAQSPAEEVV